ncbi:MAG: bacteriocin immunity protein [Ligilactobacillus agilis]|uniref:bacteriocin immunity protein n=1 Tax=Ligilactobacillus agilis TaxID=1601 RepID=UPI00242D3F5C|nr:bacteriocin immunity protein [Ligilactobacillus agilis]MCI5761428.1 bacteriocin immunity protein [Ligilactobacillus agilis]
MTKVTKTEIMNEVYDLILNANVTQDERAILVNFKNRVTDKNFANELMRLAVGLRQLGIKNLAAQKKMSPETSAFYKKIATYGQQELNWARGLAMTGVIF